MTESTSPSGSERWSATENSRISATVSPSNSIRSGWSAVVGNTSTIPPRTATSPRRATMSSRTYANSASSASRSPGSSSAPLTTCTGSRRAATTEMGCTTDRAAATTIRGARPAITALSTCSRRPMVSAAGERRSWGNVSQLGNCATPASSSSKIPASSSASSSHSRSVAVTTNNGACCANAETRNGRSDSGERTTAASRGSPSRNPASAGFARTAPARPDRAAGAPAVDWFVAVAVDVTRVLPPGGKRRVVLYRRDVGRGNWDAGGLSDVEGQSTSDLRHPARGGGTPRPARQTSAV